ncbi:MAG: AIR synthase related protein [Acidimicrobiales bacterium]
MNPAAYEAAGVDYDILDAAKRAAVDLAAATLANPARLGADVARASLGEPATIVQIGDLTLAVVLECLGTKSMIAREVEGALGLDRWEAVGVDAVAAVVNDLCCVGALPLTLNAYFATGSADWYAGSRHRSLVAGWERACSSVGAAWVGGESPTLPGLVDAEQIDLAGSALGRLPAGRSPWLSQALLPGDEIVFVGSSGLHANGASLARWLAKSADRCPGGWATELPDGRPFGDAVLDPTTLYPGLVEALFGAEIPVHYATNISGHGLRKVMRAQRQLTYRVTNLPEVPAVLAFLASRAGLDARESYGTLNMGVGFAVFVAEGQGPAAAAAAAGAGYPALVAGTVEPGTRQVVIEPIGVTYGTEELQLA